MALSSRGLWVVAVCGALACAEGTTVAGGGARGEGGSVAGGGDLGGAGGRGEGAHTSGSGGVSSGGASTGGSAPMPQSCPTGQLATGFDALGAIACAPVDDVTHDAFHQGCRVHLGVKDGCGGCGDPPTKWGWVSAEACSNGAGADDTCSVANLGGTDVQLFGLNTDGDVDDNDKLYARFGCDSAPLDVAPGPCAGGAFLVDADGSCGAGAAGVLDAVGAECTLYLGWLDGCDGCTSPPSKWGSAGTSSCVIGGGGGNTCGSATLGAETMQLFGLDFDGDVDGNDKIHVGLACTIPTSAPVSGVAACPTGQYVVATSGLGTVDCAPIAPLAIDYVRQHCSVYFGWIDGCGACASTPTKWGKVGPTSCTNGAGLDDTCTVADLGGTQVQLFGLSTDGDVNDDDKLYVGLRCD